MARLDPDGSSALTLRLRSQTLPLQISFDRTAFPGLSVGITVEIPWSRGRSIWKYSE